MKIAICIVNYNSFEDIVRLIRNFGPRTVNLPVPITFEFYILDNNQASGKI